MTKQIKSRKRVGSRFLDKKQADIDKLKKFFEK